MCEWAGSGTPYFLGLETFSPGEGGPSQVLAHFTGVSQRLLRKVGYLSILNLFLFLRVRLLLPTFFFFHLLILNL